jgi:NitT/TauT family transport system ATP-binding protein
MKDNQPSAILELVSVSHRYGQVGVLHDLSLAIREHEIVVVVGPSGCGKTTILNLLSGHIKPTSGGIQRRGKIRMVYQQDGLFPWLTVSENITMGLRQIQDKAAREKELQVLIELVHLNGFENHFPHELSGGMRQRVELARVLGGDSDILLMDEPFSALDYQSRLRMRDELIRILKKRPRTVVFVTHDIEEAAQLADRVLVLTSRPATICKELSIDSKRPRGVTDGAALEGMKDILVALGLQTHQEADIP